MSEQRAGTEESALDAAMRDAVEAVENVEKKHAGKKKKPAAEEEAAEAAAGAIEILDEDELDEAFGREQIDPETVARAREEAARLLEGARAGSWPPVVVREWTLERALAALEGGS